MKRLLAIALALLVCVGLAGCAVEKVAPVSATAPEVIDSEPEWNEDEVDAQIPDEYLTDEDDEGDWDEGDRAYGRKGVLIDSEPEWNEDEVDAQIPDGYLYDDEDGEEVDAQIPDVYLYDDEDGEEVDAQIPDEYLYQDEDGTFDWEDDDYVDGEEYEDDEVDYGIPRTLTPAPDGMAVDGNPVDYIISDELFSSQIDEISVYFDEYVGKTFAMIGYVMLPDDPADAGIFAVVRDYQESHSDDEDAEDDGEYMTAEEFAALIGSLGESGVEVEAGAAPTDAPASEVTASPEPAPTSAPGITVEPEATASLGDLASPLPELGAQITVEPDPEADAEDEDGHVHEIYPVGIDCYFEGDIPQADAWVRVVGTLEEYEYYDAEAEESLPALRLRIQTVTPVSETEGGSRLVTQ